MILKDQVTQQISAILNKKMDRTDFLKHVALGMVAISGAGAALKYFAPIKSGTTHHADAGYGSSPYGGLEDGK